MLYTKFSSHRPFGSGEDFLKFLPYMGMVASWSCDQDRLNKFPFPRPKEAPYESWLKSAQWFQRIRCLKMLTHTHTHTHTRTTEAYLYYKLTNERAKNGDILVKR